MDIENPSELNLYLAGRGYQILGSETLPGGVSNRTVLVQISDGSSIVVKQARDRLKSQSDWRSDPRRITQEGRAMEWLPRWTLPGSIPRLCFLDEANHILVMEAIPQPHYQWKQQLLAGHIEESTFRQFGELLAAVHRGSYLESPVVEPVFREQSFFFSLRLEAYYLFTAERIPEAAGFLRQLVKDCQVRRFALVHGDFSPKNVLVHGERLVLLDHEAAHFGDPTFDVGFGLTHLLSKALHLTEHRQRMRRGAHRFWQAYQGGVPANREFSDVSARSVRQTLGCSLARVAGKSLLEYLTPLQREAQREIVLNLIDQPPDRIEDLIEAFIDRIP